jgi:translation elongation factor EF-G
LPTQTTEDPRPLLAWQEQPESWTHIELAANNAGQVTEALLRITLTEAQESSADQSKQETKQSAALTTPARALWRYAIVNLPHPTLEPDLRILDMPGSNALAEEPERALGLLETCDLLVFVLSAETGLTASELALWRQHLVQGEGAGCEVLVVLNKADAFWDSRHDVRTIEGQLHQQRLDVATALGIAPERVVSVSASKAIAAKGTGDAALLARSDLSKLEQLLWETLFVAHQHRGQQDLSNELARCKAAMEQVLLIRTQELKQEKALLLAQERSFDGGREKIPADETEIQRDYKKQQLNVQVIESTLLVLLEKIRRTLQMPDLAATIDTLDHNLRQSEGLPSVRRAYEKAQKDVQARWKLVEHWAGEMGQVLAASDLATDSKSDSKHQSPPPLQLAPYSALLKEALHGHLQFLGNSQVHKLKQSDFTGKLVNALRAPYV